MGCCTRNDDFYSFVKKNSLVHSNCKKVTSTLSSLDHQLAVARVTSGKLD